ncbi:MAG: QueT transporter family protein [Coprobacillus sp.]|nr:QueT transporter family protein [Coprobacillus sp.]MDY4145483.1 QueT transporter family protein [Bacilli bacterium]
METKTKKITRLAIIAGLYAALTIVFSFISYGEIQVRLSEMLIILCFFSKDYILSLTFGCLIANVFSPFGIVDCIFGTLATFLSAIFIYISRRYFKFGLFVSCLWPVLFNGIIVGIEIAVLSDISIGLSILYVSAGELIAMMIGYFVMKILSKKQYFLELIKEDIDLL